MAGISTRFISAADLTLQLVAAHHQGRLAQYFSRVVQRSKLLVIAVLAALVCAQCQVFTRCIHTESVGYTLVSSGIIDRASPFVG